MASFRSKPVTDDHPPEMVDAGNWKRYAIGHCGHEVVREGEHLVTDLLIGDAAGAERALAGAELSNGYLADFDFTKGETPAGEPYDAVQRSIRGNHVALVETGRCGGSCRIGDTASGSSAGPCQCGSGDAALSELRQRLSDMERHHARALEAKDGELAALSATIPDAAGLDALVAERAGVIEAAERVLGPGFVPAGRGVTDLRRLVVAQALGLERVAQQSDAYVAAAFDALSAARPAANPLAAHLATAQTGPSRQSALGARNRYLTDAWKSGAVPVDQHGDS